MVYCVFISALNQQVPSKGATNYDIMTCSNINDFAVFTCRPVWCLFSGYNCGFDYWKWIGFQWIFISRHHQLGATSESNSILSAGQLSNSCCDFCSSWSLPLFSPGKLSSCIHFIFVSVEFLHVAMWEK